MSAVPYGDRKAMVDAILGAIKQGRPVRRRRRHRADADRQGLPRVAARGDRGRDESDLDERRAAAATDRALHGPAGTGHAGLSVAARIANHMERVFREMGKDDDADKFKGFDWKTEEDAFMDGYHLNADGR